MSGMISCVRCAALCLITMVGVIAPSASAQVAPAGNAHPQAQATDGRVWHEPFGEAQRKPSGSMEQKLEFADAVDLSPLRDLAVFHNGRVKILDTLARESVAGLVGKDRFKVFIENDGEQVERSFDPLFTLLDMTIDPSAYIDPPLVHIGYLPLRREIIEQEMPMDPGATEEQAREIRALRERELKLTRVSLIAIYRHLEALEREHAGSGPYAAGIADLRRALARFDSLGDTMMLIAPEGKGEAWHHISEHAYPRYQDAEAIASALGEAWRERDANSVNASIAELAAILPTINSKMYPGSRRSLELSYNRADLFTWGYWTYLLATVVLLLAVSTQRRWLRVSGVGLLLIAIGLHTTGFVSRCVIAERWAIQNQFESMIGVSLFGALLATGIMFRRKTLLIGAAAAAMGFLVLITATEAQIPGKSIGREAAILNTSVLLKYHVTTVLTSYGLISLGFVLSVFFLVTHYAKRLGRGDAATGTSIETSPNRKRGDSKGKSTDGNAHGRDAPATENARATNKGAPKRKAITGTLRDLDRATMTVLQLAFWTLAVGILLGAWWADHSWGRFWAFDPKETWALATWIIYLIVIHVRPVAKNRELATAWLSVLGFIVMLWTYFGVNLLLPGLHSYA